MISRETARYSMRNMRQRKARSFFTILSIFIGISTIFLFISFGLGLYSYIDELTQGSSADKLLIQAKGGTLAMFESNVRFTDNDIEAVERVAGVRKVTGAYIKIVEAESQDKKIFTMMVSYDSKNPIVMEMSNVGIVKGRNFDNGKKEIVLGFNYMVDGKIFPRGLRLNQNIEVNGEDIKIVGFYEEVGSAPDDAQMYTSSDYMEELFVNENLSYVWIIAQVEDVDYIDNVKSRIESELRKERGLEKGKEDFYVQSFNDMIEGFSSALNIVIGFIVLISLISVLVSAVNTANTMITSVLERYREIGIIKSIGARNSDVFGIFLFESGSLGLVAGIVGVLVGYGLAMLAGTIIDYLGYGFLQPSFPWWLFTGCIAFATMTGAISGVWPAVSASKINPVEALRYE